MSDLAVPEISDLDVAFGANALDWMPAREDLPDEFRKDWHSSSNEWCVIASSWFYNGLPSTVKFYPRKGVDAEAAVRVIRATLGSWAPSHEHKIGATGYMLSCWFRRVSGWKVKP